MFIPCRQKNPHLIELYNKHKSKGFEIIGVADDDYQIEVWKKAISDDKLSWRQILRGQDREKSYNNIKNLNDISENYDVHLLPTVILINREGYIVNRFVGNSKPENERLTKKLSDIFD